jgi:hypothetical protein
VALKTLTEQIFDISGKSDFEVLALDVFKHQHERLETYRNYCDLINRPPENVKSLSDIPFLPISFFKSHRITQQDSYEILFKSSGTANLNQRSCHYVANASIYERSLATTFELFLGDPGQFEVFSMLPGYEDNPESSLIYMVEHLAKLTDSKKVHAYPTNFEKLAMDLQEAGKQGSKCLLFGVSFALMDFAALYPMPLENVTIIETGGMKGRRAEITREEMHLLLKEKLNPESLISEYGMTELLSQAYAIDSVSFKCPPWMKVFVRDIQDPFSVKTHGSGVLNIIDLANVNSCSFIATDDIARISENESFEVIGRYDHSDVRGCNLLYEGID